MVIYRVFLGVGLAMLFSTYCAAQFSTESTFRYSSNVADSDLKPFDAERFNEIYQMTNSQPDDNLRGKLIHDGEKFSSKRSDDYNSHFLDSQTYRNFGSDFTFSIRTPSYGIFDLKNSRDNFSQYRGCLSKNINYAEQSRCNIEILFGKKFHL